MKKRVYIGIFIINLILITNILAYESTITVKTGLPNHLIEFKPANPDTGKAITSLTKTADSSGVVVFDYNLDEVRIKMGFQAFNNAGRNVNFLNGKPIIFFRNVILDKFVDIDLNKAEPSIEIYSGKTEEEQEEELIEETEEEIVEERENEEAIEEVVAEDVPAEEQSESSPLTGRAIESVKNIALSKKTYYILGGIIILLIAFIFFKKKINKKGNFKIIKLSEIKKNKEKLKDTDDRLEDAEKKLKEAKEELDEIRDKKNKLKEVQERLERDKEELKKLEED